MTRQIPRTSFACPGCSVLLESAGNGATQCPDCRWRGEVFHFSPARLQVNASEAALPEEATCAHHPGKKAVGICSVTGDYLCALCLVEVDGRTLSIQHLNSKAGRDHLKNNFDRYLPRPDRALATLVALTILIWPVAPITLPFAIYYLLKTRKMRRESPVLKRLVTRKVLWVYFLFLLALTGGGLFLLVTLLIDNL